MRLTWKDAVATGILAGGGGLYAWHLSGADIAVVESERLMAVVLFVAGTAACATGANYSKTGRYVSMMSGAAAVAFALMITTVVWGSEVPLAALAGLIGAMWLITTVRHALGIYPPAPEPVFVPDGSHEALPADQHR